MRAPCRRPAATQKCAHRESAIHARPLPPAPRNPPETHQVGGEPDRGVSSHRSGAVRTIFAHQLRRRAAPGLNESSHSVPDRSQERCRVEFRSYWLVEKRSRPRELPPTTLLLADADGSRSSPAVRRLKRRSTETAAP